MRPRTSHDPAPAGEIPVLTVAAETTGPVAVVTANLHGDECVGVGAVHALVRELPGVLRRGTVHLYPSLNRPALEQGTRHVPDDGHDLNRSFPGDGRGGSSARLADRIWKDVLARKPDVVIDLHTDAAGAIPYAIVDRVVRGARRLNDRCRALAEGSGLTVLGEYPKDRYLQYGLDKSLPGALVNGPGIPAVTLEVGPRRVLDPESVAIAVEATIGVLTAAGIAKRPARAHPTRVEGGTWRRESGPRASFTGLLVPLVRPGDRVAADQPLAEVRTLEGRVLQVLAAPVEAVVVSLPERAWVLPGASCATLAVGEV